MRTEIIQHIDDPAYLEKIYRENKGLFKKEFMAVYPDISAHIAAKTWYARLNFEGSEISWGTGYDLIFVIFASFIAGSLAKLPQIFSISEEFFYSRNISFCVFPFLTVFFLWKNKSSGLKLLSVLSIFVVCSIYVNTLPDLPESNSLALAFIHLPLFLWSVLGFSFAAEQPYSAHKRLAFLRYNGDLVVICSLILICGGILTGLTIGLFSLIGIDIAEFYTKYIVVYGAAAIPLVGTYVTFTNPQLVNKVSPVIAKLFSPLVLVTVLVYLVAIIFSGKDPYNDREFLLTFNVLLIGVMAIILFSVAETSRSSARTSSTLLLFLLALVTAIVNTIALSAILFRISEWGISPNRMAVLGGNVLILLHLLMVSYHLFKTLRKPENIDLVEKSMADYLPVYSLWALLVTFTFPFIFGFK